MATNSYAELTANGTAWSGDVSEGTVAGVDVSSNHFEIYEVLMGVGTGWEGASARQNTHRAHRPITLRARADQNFPLMWDALVRNQNIAGKIKLFDSATESGGDGASRQRFEVEITDGRIVDVEFHSPDSLSAHQSTSPITCTIKLVARQVRLADIVKSTECVDDWTVRN